MGREFGFHGPIRFCGGFDLLGSLGPQAGIRVEPSAHYREARTGHGRKLFTESVQRIFTAYCGLRFLPVCFCRHYCGVTGGVFVGEDEFLCVDDVRSSVAHPIVGPRQQQDREHFPPNNIIHILGGAGFLWMGWAGFNGGSPLAADLVTSLAILNTHICTATSILIWLSLDVIFYKKSSVIGAVQGMITGLVCITPGAGIVDSWAAMLMGVLAGSVPWYTMMVLHKKSAFFQRVDDTLGVFHTHAVAGILGGILSGVFAKPNLLRLFYLHSEPSDSTGFLYTLLHGQVQRGFRQMGYQLAGAAFITAWNDSRTPAG
nr:ammonium transporter 3 member 1-like [Ipomoea batatas]